MDKFTKADMRTVYCILFEECQRLNNAVCGVYPQKLSTVQRPAPLVASQPDLEPTLKVYMQNSRCLCSLESQ